MEFTLEEILDDRNNGKEYICLTNGSIVKNNNGTLLFAKKMSYTGQKINNVVQYLKTKNKKILLRLIPASLIALLGVALIIIVNNM